MNRIYKVIYSKARQCYIVVSELAKSNHKSSQQGADHTNTPALARIIAVALAAGALTWGSVPGVSWAADNTAVTDSNGNTVTKDINANITGKKNTVTDSSNAEIVGDGNTVTNEAKGEDGSVRYVRSNDARIHGSGNTISASRNQQVIGDNNTIMGRDDGTVTDYQHPEGREPNVSDLTIGRGNFIRSTDTYRNEWDSLKVIGNNNRADFKIESAGGPAAGIVIGDNQNIDGIKDSIVIGSLSPDEQKEQVGEDGYKSDKYFVGSNSVVVGYHATSSKDASTVIGNRSKVSGNYQTVTGLRSTIEGNYYNSLNLLDGQSGNFASIYGSFNKIEDATGEDDMDGVGNSINGSMNVTSNARGTMIMGVGNTVTHSKGEFLFPKDDDSSISTGDLLYVGAFTASDYAQGRDITGDNLTYPADQVYAYMRDAWQRYMETSGGAVSVLGNSNTSDYAIRSQILGTNNMLKGAEGNISSYNTISGFSNTGENVKRTAIVGTGNTLRNSEDNVVIGDYHNLENGKHNVILGSMASEEKAVTKTAKAAWAATDDNPDGTYTYTVNEQVALKPDPKVIENAVMVGYNTDVTKSGGVALGADSIASTEDGITGGITGFDALGKKHINSDKDYSTWVSTDAAVSVGGADREVKYNDKEGKEQTKTVKSTRQITNVAAGTQDTDAVNVAQLKAVSSAINTDITASKTHFYSVNSEDATAGNYNNNGATGANALAAGVGAKAEADHSIAIGTNAWTNEGDSRAKGSGDIAIGNNSKTGNYVNQSGSIAIGQNAETANMAGNQEAIFAFGQTKYSGTTWSPNRLPDDASKVPTAIAIGQNSYARTGGLMIGTHNYNGKLGDVTVNSNDTNDVNAKSKNVFTTTLGTNSYNAGAFSTVTGAYSIASGSYNGGRSGSGPSKNFGATITGSLNSIESATSSSPYSGIANSIVGTANSTSNSNGSLVFGAGNTIKNSVTDITNAEEYGIPTLDLSNAESAKKLQDNLMTAVRDNKSGGAALVIGGGNTIDRSIRSQVIGVNNKLTGNLYHEDKWPDPDINEYSTQYNMIDGYNNQVANVNHAYVIGANNIIQGKKFSDATKDGVLSEKDRDKAKKDDNLIVIGDNHTLANDVSNNIILGTADADKKLTTSASNVVMIGYNADAKKEGGVALGAGSVASIDAASIDANAIGYDPATKKASTDASSTWKSTAAAVSIGDASQNITRQITNLAAGAQDTDAVNVAQLKAAQTHFYSVNSTDETADNYNNDGAKGKNSLAAGVGALANGSNSVAIGTKAKAQNDALAVGESANAGNNGIAIGMHANAGYGQNMALGYYASVANGVSNSTALGYGSQVTKRDILQSDGSDGVVSVGKSVGQSGEKGMTRRIINVKDGVKATDAANVSQLTELKEGEHISITDSATPNEKGQTVKTISVKVDGQIEKGNTGILSGDTVYKEVHVDKDGNYIKSGYTVAENLNALDGKVKTNADNIEKNGQAIEKNSARIDTNSKNIEKNGQAIETNSARIDTNSKNIEKNSQAIEKNSARIDTNSKNIEKNSQAIEKNSARIDTNSKNIEKNGQAIETNSARIDTNSKNIEKNGQAIETNSARIDTNSKNIEKNSQAIEKNSARIDTNSKNIETLQKTKADTNLSNITDAGKTVINNIAKKSVKVEAGSSNVSVTTKDVADGPITYTVDVAKDLHVNSITSKTVTSDSVTAKTVTSDTVKTKNLSVSESASIGDVTINKGNQGTIDDLKNTAWDAKNITSGRAATEDQVKAATKNAVNYDDDTSKTITLREDTTIKNVANTAIEQGSKNAVNAGTVYNETRVKQDGKYVKASNTAGENLSVLDNQVASNSSNITNLNGRVNNLDSKVNKVGAGAAALAALHPLDFDPEDKWDFAVGYGNYRDANSVAVGAFYRPDDDTMFSVGTNFGNGENMINAGVSFKFGPKGKSQVRPGSTQEITELRATVARQDDQLKKQDSEIKELKAMVQQLMAKQDKQAATK